MKEITRERKKAKRLLSEMGGDQWLKEQMGKNLKRYRSSKMSRRWLASCLLHAEKQFRTIRGFKSIPVVIENIRREQEKKQMLKEAA